MSRKAPYLISLSPLRVEQADESPNRSPVPREAAHQARREEILRQIGATFRQAADRAGFSPAQLAYTCGYRNMQKGAGRVTRLIK